MKLFIAYFACVIILTLNKGSMAQEPTRIYVGNLAYSVTDSELQGFCEQAGQVLGAKVSTDRETGSSRGFGFCEYANAASAERAAQQLNGANFEGRTVVVYQL